jgi:hypothetical protein
MIGAWVIRTCGPVLAKLRPWWGNSMLVNEGWWEQECLLLFRHLRHVTDGGAIRFILVWCWKVVQWVNDRSNYRAKIWLQERVISWTLSLLRPYQPSRRQTNARLQINNTKPNQGSLFSCSQFRNWELPLLKALDYRTQVCEPRPSLLVMSYGSLLLASRKRNHPHGHLGSSSLATEQFTHKRQVSA